MNYSGPSRVLKSQKRVYGKLRAAFYANAYQRWSTSYSTQFLSGSDQPQAVVPDIVTVARATTSGHYESSHVFWL
jgi:hypothetical protein